MRFKISEYKEFVQILETYSLNPDLFKIWKKRGWINFSAENLSDIVFSFHRKKESKIINGNFTDTISYRVKLSGQKEITTDNWQLVVDQFEFWIKNIGSN